MKRGELKEIIREEIQNFINEKSISQKYLDDIKKYKPFAKKKLQKMGFKVKEIKNKDAFKITGGDMSKLHLNYISTTSSGNDTIIGGSQFEAITKIK